MEKRRSFVAEQDGVVIAQTHTDGLEENGVCIQRCFNFNTGTVVEGVLDIETKEVMSPKTKAIDSEIVESYKFAIGEDVPGWKNGLPGTLFKRIDTKKLTSKGLHISKKFNLASGDVDTAIIKSAEDKPAYITKSHVEHVVLDARREAIRYHKSKYSK